jgi:hypothetical protein
MPFFINSQRQQQVISTVDAILKLVTRYSHLGDRKLDNGTVLCGKAPHAGAEAYLHHVFPACSASDLKSLQSQVPAKMPDALKGFLAEHNGFDLFNGTLSFFGLRKLSGRSYDAVMGQPYCIVAANTRERPGWLEEGTWIVGGYNWDGSKLCLSQAGKVSVREPETGQVAKEWSSLEKFLTSETKRLPALFDEKGEEIDDDASTLPS